MNKIERHKQICEHLNKVYQAKNEDYGDSFSESFDEWGPVSAVVRMDDKMRRIKQLINNPAKVKGESLVDSVEDLANYCIMLRLELGEVKNESHVKQGNWHSPINTHKLFATDLNYNPK